MKYIVSVRIKCCSKNRNVKYHRVANLRDVSVLSFGKISVLGVECKLLCNASEGTRKLFVLVCEWEHLGDSLFNGYAILILNNVSHHTAID